MSKKKLNSLGGLVYSTDPDFKVEEEENEQLETLPPSQQKIKVRLDTKHRAGKAVTLIEGFVGTTIDREELGKKVKTFCGTGGSVKDEQIIVQGDNREKDITMDAKKWIYSCPEDIADIKDINYVFCSSLIK